MGLIAKVLEARASVGEGKARLAGLELDPERINVEFILSAMAACAAKKVKEATGASVVEVAVKVYADVEKLLEGEEEIDHFRMEVALRGVEAKASSAVARKAVFECPIVKIVKDKIREVVVTLKEDGSREEL